jgi:TPR repeat protein
MLRRNSAQNLLITRNAGALHPQAIGLFLMGSHYNELGIAKDLIAKGEYSGASKYLNLLVAQRVPEALFWASTFSSSAEETDSQFEERSFRMLKESAELGYLPAMYALASCYEAGDLVEQSDVMATEWYGVAANLGDIRAKFRYGLALLEGVGAPRDMTLGAKLIREAAESGVEGAKEVVEKLRDQP